MLVKEIMTPDPACCTADSSLQEVAKMMVEFDCGCIPVVENAATRTLLGVVTDRDISTRAVAEGRNPLDLTAGDIMTADVVAVTPEMTLEDCCNLMEQRQIRRACCG